MKVSRFIVSCASILTVAGCNLPELPTEYRADMTSDAVRPGAGHNGSKGYLNVKLDGTSLTVLKGYFSGMDTNVTTVSIRGPADTESVGEEICAFERKTPALNGNINEGTCTLTEEQAQAMRDGKVYVTLLTAGLNADGTFKYPDGETRGQFVYVKVLTSADE